MNCPRCGREIQEHEAGGETDLCVSVAVMSYMLVDDEDGVVMLPSGARIVPPDYSTDISAAWEVRAKLIEKGYGVCGAWSPVPQCEDWNVWDSRSGLVTVPAQASTAPLAICRLGLTVAAGEAKGRE